MKETSVAVPKKPKEKEKNKDSEAVPVDEVLVDEVLEEVNLAEIDIPLVAEVAPPVNGTPAKKPLGVKEVIPFQWKLVGTANNMTLTLFKAVEREDVEAQLDRVQKEGYYTNLLILEANAKVAQPKPLPKPAEPKSSKSGKLSEAASKPSKDKAESAAKLKSKKTAPAPKAKSASKPKKAEKTAKRTAKKK